MEQSKVDVLVIGAGPSGLMLCTWLARLGIKTRIIDKRHNRINSGQADGLQSRTFEILDSLGIGQDIWREANRMLEIRFWNPDEDNRLYRSDMIVDTTPGISRFQQATLQQARIEDYLLKYIGQYGDIAVEYGKMPESLHIDAEIAENDEEFPISVTIRHLPPEANGVPNGITNASHIPNGMFRSNLTADNTDSVLAAATANETSKTETIHAKYVVGCDGAHSWTRRQIGSVMEGEQTDFIWGVLDIVPITDFPDIRYRCAIHSASGSMMIIPRENKYVRLYIQVSDAAEDGQPVDRSKINQETLLRSAQKILTPYKLTYKHCHWWTAYRIGQRVGSKFSAHDRVFLAGDAVHTHSPKAGQGMNISMHDTYNLGWKLAHVIKGQSSRSLLATYTSERRQIAQELINFDHRFSQLFSGRLSKDLLDEEGIDLKIFKDVFEKGNLFASGTAVDYATNLIVAKDPAHQADALTYKQNYDTPFIGKVVESTPCILTGKQHLARRIPIGMRMPSYKVLNQSDARPWHLQELISANGTWRVIVFAGDLLDAAQFARYVALGKALDSTGSFLHKYTPKSASVDSVFEVLTVHSAPRASIELLSLPAVFHPYNEEYGWDYSKVFVDDVSYHEGHGHAYENYGIDHRTGCMVVLRPDQYVSWIGELEDLPDLERFFGAFMKTQR
ncbi:FAD binding domain-containing protein [Leptodontidium sp. 2 PMI_412]|nr:FAD binding domain-containing protein [Leptodontidium sp. 2 PMI_412]